MTVSTEPTRFLIEPFDRTDRRVFLGFMSTVLAWRGVPKSYLYVGFGNDLEPMVSTAKGLGVDSWGVCNATKPNTTLCPLEHAFELVALPDLNQPTLFNALTLPPSIQNVKRIPKTFDLTTCLDVADRLETWAAPTLCESLANHVAVGGILIFSASTPGQQDHELRNCRPAHYWKDLFHELGVSYRDDYTMQLSHLLSWIGGPSKWLAANIQVFDR